MKKNIFRELVVIIAFVLFTNNFAFAEDVVIPPIDTQAQVDSIPVEVTSPSDSNQNIPVVIPETVSINMKITTNNGSIFNRKMDVKPCDSDSNPNTPDTITAYCAVSQTGIPTVWDWSWAPGAFLTSLNSISGFTSKDKDGNDVYHYWSWYQNNNEGMTGLNQYVLQPGDSISLVFIDPVEEQTTKHSGSSTGSIVEETPIEKIFSIPSALSYLSTNQKSDGLFGSDLYTDWVSVGIVKSGEGSQSIENKILDYYKKENIELSLSVTDSERHAMALMSLGIDPYNGTKINYIDKIISSYDGTQIGDKDLYNDDIFGLIVLAHAGYTKDDEIIKNVVTHVLSKQSDDGSWGSVDMTSAAIEALRNFNDLDKVSEVTSKGEEYLKKNQKNDGSFDDNSYSTSWAVQALSNDDSFKMEVENGIKYLTDKQQSDGGLGTGETSNRIWGTAYAIPAVMKLSWNDILLNFPKVEIKKSEAKTQEEKIIIQPKRENVIAQIPTKKQTENKLLSEVKSNLLEATAVVPVQKEDSFLSSFYNFFRRVGFPFFSFWIRPGF